VLSKNSKMEQNHKKIFSSSQHVLNRAFNLTDLQDSSPFSLFQA
jgi:hypothetical protein